MSKPGRVRVKLAALLQESFPTTKGGTPITWLPENLCPATGAWRTKLDCWRWEGWAIGPDAAGKVQPLMGVGSYDTMSALIKAKRLQVSPDGDIHPLNEDKP